MLDWLYNDGRNYSPVYRAAYVMWKINAIHPFNGGNGRVARAVAYLVVVSEIAPVFAGESLPTKLKARKAERVHRRSLQEPVTRATCRNSNSLSWSVFSLNSKTWRESHATPDSRQAHQ